MQYKNTIGIIHGGDSPEGKVSTLSAKSVKEALDSQNYLTQLIDITNPKYRDDLLQVKLVFNCLHGEFGEDGQLQEILEKMKLAFTGTGPLGSRLCRDKLECKKYLFPHKVITPLFYECISDAKRAFAKNNSKFLLKKRMSGGGIGISKVNVLDDFKNINSNEFFVEEFISGKPITIGIIEKEGKEYASPIIEIILPNGKELYDYESKVKCTAKFKVLKLSNGNSNKIQDIAIKVHKLTHCRGFSRIDFILRNGTPYFLEINTIPSLFEGSSYRYSMEKLGVSFNKLCSLLLESVYAKKSKPI